MDIIELQVERSDFRRTRLATRPAPELQPGEVLAKVDRFALTANNISYALSGDMIGYWKFFPAEDPWGIVPVWGFADVVASSAADVPTGARLWGFFPMASHVVLTPGPVRGRGFVDISAHRKALPDVYNRYNITNDEKPELRAIEDERSLMFPLFATSYILYDYLTDNDFFGADQVLIGSVSSKTGFGLAELLSRHAKGRVKVIGLTSPANVGFVEKLGLCDAITPYSDIPAMDAAIPTAFVDMAGSGPVTAAVHARFGAQVKASVSVGATHWQAERHRGPVEGAAPAFFFAPAQIMKREQDWGPGEILRRAQAESVVMIHRVRPHLRLSVVRGPEAAQAAYARMVEGAAGPEEGLILSLSS